MLKAVNRMEAERSGMSGKYFLKRFAFSKPRRRCIECVLMKKHAPIRNSLGN